MRLHAATKPSDEFVAEPGCRIVARQHTAGNDVLSGQQRRNLQARILFFEATVATFSDDEDERRAIEQRKCGLNSQSENSAVVNCCCRELLSGGAKTAARFYGACWSSRLAESPDDG